MTELDTELPSTTAVPQVLAAAFIDDPVFAWLVPDRAELAEILEPVFVAFAAAFARHDETYLRHVADRPAGVAMWAPPGEAPVHPDDEPALMGQLLELTGTNMVRFEQCLEAFEAVHPADPAWYLQFLGVEPDLQGRGIGGDLLRTVLDRADAAGQPAYLEATSLRNRALYERHGFRLRSDIVLPGGPTAYGMWRDPR